MPNKRLTVSLFIALVALPPANRLEGQIGGLIKKKVTESVKGDKKDQAAPKDEGAAGQGVGNEASKLPMKLTDNALTAFRKGLEAELEHRRATVKRIASLKTPEQHRACTQTVAASPEAQKIMMAPANLPATATADQVQKATEKMATDLAKLSTDKCGEDPRPYDDGWRARQVQAAEDAGAKVFAAGLGTPPGGGGPYLAFEQEQGQELGYYRQLKEWVPPFCNLPKKDQQAAAGKGIKIPGNGNGIFFVYTADEARLLTQQCDALMKLLSELV